MLPVYHMQCASHSTVKDSRLLFVASLHCSTDLVAGTNKHCFICRVTVVVANCIVNSY